MISFGIDSDDAPGTLSEEKVRLFQLIVSKEFSLVGFSPSFVLVVLLSYACFISYFTFKNID